MPGDISRSFKGPKDGSVPSWMDEPSSPTLARPEKIATPLADEVQAEMRRIKRLFERSDGDREDMISYAKEIVRLRAPVEPAPSEFDIALMEERDRLRAALIEISSMPPLPDRHGDLDDHPMRVAKKALFVPSTNS